MYTCFARVRKPLTTLAGREEARNRSETATTRTLAVVACVCVAYGEYFTSSASARERLHVFLEAGGLVGAGGAAARVGYRHSTFYYLEHNLQRKACPKKRANKLNSRASLPFV